MRILQVHNRYREPGGEDAVVDAERTLLTDGGHEVDLIEFDNPTTAVAATRTLLRAPWNQKNADAVVERARRFRPDVVHVHNTWFALSPVVFRAVAAAGFPTVATIHNYRLLCLNAQFYRDGRICEDCVGRWPWPGVLHRCYRSSAAQSGAVAVTIVGHRIVGTWEKHTDVVVALTSFAARYLASAGVPGGSIVVKPNTVADPGPRPSSPSSSDMLLFVGRLSPEKGIEDLLQAWASKPDSPRHLCIAGDGPLRATVESAVASSGSMSFLGRLESSEVADLMRRARSLVLPSRWFEGMPMVLVEAAAAGLPAIVPQHGALPGIVADGGLTYRSGSMTDLVRALVEMEDDRLVDDLGMSARTHYETTFRPEAGLESLERIYEIAIEKRAARK